MSQHHRPRESAGRLVTGACKLTRLTRRAAHNPAPCANAPFQSSFSGSGTGTWLSSSGNEPGPSAVKRYCGAWISIPEVLSPPFPIKSPEGGVCSSIRTVMRGVRVSLVNWHAPVTGRAAFSRGHRGSGFRWAIGSGSVPDSLRPGSGEVTLLMVPVPALQARPVATRSVNAR
jgi:hypothetical protein